MINLLCCPIVGKNSGHLRFQVKCDSFKYDSSVQTELYAVLMANGKLLQLANKYNHDSLKTERKPNL